MDDATMDEKAAVFEENKDEDDVSHLKLARREKHVLFNRSLLDGGHELGRIARLAVGRWTGILLQTR